MLKKIAIICGAFLALFPCVSKADFDPTTIIQDKIVIVNEEMNKILKEKTGFELDLQELVNNRKAFTAKVKNGLKAYAMDKAMAYGSKIKVKQVTLSGLGEKIKGDRSNPELEKALGKKITRKKRQSGDVLKTRKQLNLINNMQVENVAAMYANALVERRAVIDEGNDIEEEEKTELEDLTTVTSAYKAVSLRANSRWNQILKAQSSYYTQLAATEMVNLRVMESVDEDNNQAQSGGGYSPDGEDNQDGDVGQDGSTTAENDDSDMSLTDLYKKGKNTYNDVSKGNYSGALGDIAEGAGGLGYGDAAGYVSDAKKAYDTGKSAADNVSRGNWSGLAGDIAGGAADLGYGDAAGYVSDAQKVYDTGKSASDNVSRGNWSGVANDIAGGAADLGGKYGDEGTKEVLAGVKSATETGGRAYNNAVSGNYGAAMGDVVDGAANAMGDKLDDKTKNILSGASSGLNSADKVSDSISNGNWKGAVSGAVSGAGKAASQGLGGGTGSKVADDAAHNVNTGINATTNAIDNFGNGNTVDGLMDLVDGMSNLQDTTGKD